MTFAYRSADIDRLIADLTPANDVAPYLDDATAIPVIRRMHEPRQRRGSRPLTFTAAILWLAFTAFVVVGLGASLAGICAGIEALSAMGATR